MALNNGVEVFPSNIVAGLFGFRQATYFEVAEAEAATPKVDLR
jgi:LemA protein